MGLAPAIVLTSIACSGADETALDTGDVQLESATRESGTSLHDGRGHHIEPGRAIDPDKFDGQRVFRFDTFGDERFWTDILRLNEAIQAALTPELALQLGLKVDADAVPPEVLANADLTDPATTVALIQLNAVVGVVGRVRNGRLVRVGVTCALCHSTVDDSVLPGIGSRVDGPANRDLDPGAIIALSPGLAGDQAALDVLRSWGPGRYDPRWNQDGLNGPVWIPPIYGLQDVPLETYTGDGPISYWNAYVGTTQMGAQGQFFDPRIDVAEFRQPDLLTPKLPALYDYQVSLEAPEPPPGSFDPAAAARGRELFEGEARCDTCHFGPALSDVVEHRLHDPEETGMDPFYASRSATKHYRTTPLRGLLDHPPYFHDGSAETLAEVVEHYDDVLGLDLDAGQRSDLEQYLRSL